MAKRKTSGVIPLRPRQKSSWPQSPSARLRELLKRRDITHLVRTMPVPDLYNFVRQLGLADSGDLLALASGDQLQQMTDLEVWNRDRLESPRLIEWLEAIFASDPEKVAQRVGELDPEVILSLLLRHVLVFPNDGDEMDPHIEREIASRDVIPTPDDVFFIEITGEPDEVDFIRRMIIEVYNQDVDLARSLLFRLIAQLPSDLEETAYRMRQGRVEGLGFVDYYEALKIFQALPAEAPLWPRSPQGSGSDLQQVPLAPELARPRRGSFLAQALTAFRDAHPRDAIDRDLLHLANKVAAAELWDPGDEASAGLALTQVHDALGLGLEALSGGDLDAAVRILREVHVERIFREAQTLVIGVQRRALKGLAAVQETMGLPRDLTPWPDPPNRGIFEALRGRTPRFDPTLIKEAGEPRSFRTLAELQVAQEAVVAGLGALAFLHLGLAIAPTEPGPIREALARGDGELRASHLLLTALGQRILGEAFAPAPLTLPQARRVIAALRAEGARPEAPKGLRPELLQQLRQVGIDRGDLPGVEALIEAVDGAFRESYGGLDLSQPLDPRFTQGPLLLTAPSS